MRSFRRRGKLGTVSIQEGATMIDTRTFPRGAIIRFPAPSLLGRKVFFSEEKKQKTFARLSRFSPAA
jgi:hypothetical protein